MYRRVPIHIYIYICVWKYKTTLSHATCAVPTVRRPWDRGDTPVSERFYFREWKVREFLASHLRARSVFYDSAIKTARRHFSVHGVSARCLFLSNRKKNMRRYGFSRQQNCRRVHWRSTVGDAVPRLWTRQNCFPDNREIIFKTNNITPCNSEMKHDDFDRYVVIASLRAGLNHIYIRLRFKHNDAFPKITCLWRKTCWLNFIVLKNVSH